MFTIRPTTFKTQLFHIFLLISFEHFDSKSGNLEILASLRILFLRAWISQLRRATVFGATADPSDQSEAGMKKGGAFDPSD